MTKKYYLLLYGFLLLSFTVFSQEGKFKALFMYNFTKYLEWPANKQNGDFVIIVFGKSDITDELKIIAAKKKVGTQNITVREVTSLSELAACHILFVSESQSSKLNEIVSKSLKAGTILITEKPGLAVTFSGINYIIVNGRQSFEINKANLEKQGVKVNSILLSLGVVVQ